MSALSRRHHGGDRQHHAAHGLPAGSGHIVTQERRSNRASPKRPPGRGGDACAASAIGVPARGPNSQIQATLTARKFGWHGEWRQAATRTLANCLNFGVQTHNLTGGDYLGWASEPFDRRERSQVRNERRDLVRRGALDLIQAFAQLRFDCGIPRRARRVVMPTGMPLT
jgi:hypothetical protein